MANNYTGSYSGITKGEQVRAQDMTDALNQMEKVVNKEQGSGSLTASSSDSNYPSSKLVGTNLALKENVSNKKQVLNNSNTEYPTSAIVLSNLNLKENTSNKKDTINDSSTEYPSSQAVYNLLPAGVILPYGGATAPSGWAFCDGRSVSSSKYPKLYAAIGTVWGGNSTNFNLPDLRGATIRGAGTSSGFTRTIGDGKVGSTIADNVTVALAQRDNDAIRNITGRYTHISSSGAANASNAGTQGAFYLGLSTGGVGSSIDDRTMAGGYSAMFDSSRVVPTAPENRVKARGVNFIIKLF